MGAFEFLAIIGSAAVLGTGCSDSSKARKIETIRIGAALPFTGKEAALGRNLEQAMLLAINDVNMAGGIDGIPLELVSADSNSGSDRGREDILSLLYDGEVRYLVGPEENDLANQLVQDVRALDVLNVLPSYAAPRIRRSTSSGAWLKLAPTAYATSCALSGFAFTELKASTTNTLATVEDYTAEVASVFASQMRQLAGTTLPSVSVQADQTQFAQFIAKVFAYAPDETLLIAYPSTAATIVTEWDVLGRPGSWYFGPLLRNEGFLSNVPYGSLDGVMGLSPSLSLPSECDVPKELPTIGTQGGIRDSVSCGRENAREFRTHFASHWDGASPFPAAHYYYDAVVLLALGLQYGLATTSSIPSAKALQRVIRTLNDAVHPATSWMELSTALETVSNGKPTRYVGAAAAYAFSPYGEAEHPVFDVWTIREHSFHDTGHYYAYCVEPP